MTTKQSSSPTPSSVSVSTTTLSEYHERYAEEAANEQELEEGTNNLLEDSLRMLKDLSSKERRDVVMKIYNDVAYKYYAPPTKQSCISCGKIMKDNRYKTCYNCSNSKICVNCGGRMNSDSAYSTCYPCNQKVEKKICVVCRLPKVRADSKFIKCFNCNRSS